MAQKKVIEVKKRCFSPILVVPIILTAIFAYVIQELVHLEASREYSDLRQVLLINGERI